MGWGPVAGKVTGGPAPYWDSYTYDVLGDRTSETNHDTSVSSNANTVTQTLAYNGYNPATGTNTAAATPDAVQSVTTTNSAGATLNTSNYTYFPDGATQTRAGQKFTYTATGLTASVQNTTTGVTSTYTYDANGTLLIQADPAGNQTIAYLPWGEQLTLNTTSSAVSGLRYITSSPDGTAIVHSSTGAVYYELTNTNGTATTQVNAATLAYAFRYFDPFGAARGTTPSSWPDQRAYLNKPADPATGLDLLGARQYDPTTGRFLSVDPVLESGDQRQMNGYSYTADNPVNSSDPSGELPPIPCNGDICHPPPPKTPGGGSPGNGGGSTPPPAGNNGGGTSNCGGSSCNPGLFDTIGLGLVNVQEIDPEYGAIMNAYATALAKFHDQSSYTPEQYELYVWQSACAILGTKICGFGPGSLNDAINAELAASSADQFSPPSGTYHPILVGASSSGQQVVGQVTGGVLWGATGLDAEGGDGSGGSSDESRSSRGETAVVLVLGGLALTGMFGNANGSPGPNGASTAMTGPAIPGQPLKAQGETEPNGDKTEFDYENQQENQEITGGGGDNPPPRYPGGGWATFEVNGDDTLTLLGSGDDDPPSIPNLIEDGAPAGGDE